MYYQYEKNNIAICTATNEIIFLLKWAALENIIPLLILIFSNLKDIHPPFLDCDSLRPRPSKEVYFGAVQYIWSKAF